MKNQIFELFGYGVSDRSEKAESYRKSCICPFHGGVCDGGGNRHQTFIDDKSLRANDLEDYFTADLSKFPPGVCSLLVGGVKWVVCPRRLFPYATSGTGFSHQSNEVARLIRNYCALLPHHRIGVWQEVKVKYTERQKGSFTKTFDYTFDYLIASVGDRKLSSIIKQTGLSEAKVLSQLEKSGRVISRKQGELFAENCPVGGLNVLEVMTSSTSGGNKAKGTTIQQCFIDALKGKGHEAPGINYRQVWARMVSQLIVKSQIGVAWGGTTLWVLQDSLVDYISRSTDLDIRKLVSGIAKQVNIASFRYGDGLKAGEPLPLELEGLFAGQVPEVKGDTDFNKLLQASMIPEKNIAENKLIFRKPLVVLNP